MKVKFHPAFWGYALLLILMGQLLPLLTTLLVVLLHEGAHAYVASKRGYKLACVTLMPYGAVLEGGENLRRRDAVPIVLAGPCANLALALLLSALWWFFPGTYPYTHLFFVANLSIAAFNLIPAYPLDGARLLVAISKKPLPVLRILRIFGVVLAAAFFALFLASFFFGLRPGAGILAIMLFLSATEGTKSERYYHLASGVFAKDASFPLPIRDYQVDAALPLKRILPTMKSEHICRYHVRAGASEQVLSEEQMGALLLSHPLHMPLGACLCPPLLPPPPEHSAKGDKKKKIPLRPRPGKAV